MCVCVDVYTAELKSFRLSTPLGPLVIGQTVWESPSHGRQSLPHGYGVGPLPVASSLAVLQMTEWSTKMHVTGKPYVLSLDLWLVMLCTELMCCSLPLLPCVLVLLHFVNKGKKFERYLIQ